MLKKVIMFLIAIAVLLVGISLSTFATNTIHPDVLKDAAKLGIKTDGLSAENLKLKIIEKLNTQYRDKAIKYGIDTTGLTDEQIKEKVVAKENADMVAKAKKSGIKTDGLTPEY
jgi:hypothetical protein